MSHKSTIVEMNPNQGKIQKKIKHLRKWKSLKKTKNQNQIKNKEWTYQVVEIFFLKIPQVLLPLVSWKPTIKNLGGCKSISRETSKTIIVA